MKIQRTEEEKIVKLGEKKTTSNIKITTEFSMVILESRRKYLTQL